MKVVDKPMTIENTQALFIDRYFDLYPKEVAKLLEPLSPKEVGAFLQRQRTELSCDVLELIPPELAAESLLTLPESRAVELLSEIEPGRAALLLNLCSSTDRERLLVQLEPSLNRELAELMTYPRGTVGRLMNTRVITFHPDNTVKQALARYRRIGQQIRNLIVVDETGRLVGLVPLASAVTANWGTLLRELIKSEPPSVLATSPREEAAEILTRYDVTTLPVVDVNLRVIGVLSHDALIRSVQEEASVGLQTMVGASKEERALSTPWFAVRKRLPWLNVNLLTAFVAAAVVGLFENTIAQFTALAVLLPVVAGQSGNTGAQALAVIMRGLALREIRLRHSMRVLFKEGLAGVINGIAIALVTSVGVWFWSGSLGLSVIIGVAMVISMGLAGLSGAAIPLVLTVLRQDPAQSGSIILTTVTDVVGFLSFLGLATIFASFI